MNYLLSEAEVPIRQALERLLDKDDTPHSFVVVHKVGTPDVFVRFSGSKGAPLLFEVPAFRISFEEVTPTEGAFRATTELIMLGILPDECVVIHEEEEETPSWMVPSALKRG